ncbi:UPF0696 protein C11orf68 homolog [Dysidea avara]|uniref:UPF0696 protein C11orf68 homolog n=1 Tax=Dysidea avara TaxID=196820 RepID=UPI00333232B7
MACGGPNRRLECGEDEEEAEEDKETFTVFEGKPEELGKFLDEHKPSDPAWNTENKEWVSVHNPLEDRDLRDLDKALDMWEDLVSNRRVTPKKIEEIALATKFTGGKWMIFKHRRIIDETWKRMAEATVAGKLGCSAKVSTTYASDTNKRNREIDQHLICVFTKNFADKDDVWRVEKALRSMGITDTLKYKPNIYTHFKLYLGNEYKIKPSLYTSK